MSQILPENRMIMPLLNVYLSCACLMLRHSTLFSSIQCYITADIAVVGIIISVFRYDVVEIRTYYFSRQRASNRYKLLHSRELTYYISLEKYSFIAIDPPHSTVLHHTREGTMFITLV